jgi:hypothetical protein
VGLVFEQAKGEPLPRAAAKFGLPGLKLLVALCRALHRAAADTNGDVFYLSCRDAGRLLGVTQQTASRWLGLLQRAGVIACFVRGSKKSGLASQYRYLGD